MRFCENGKRYDTSEDKLLYSGMRLWLTRSRYFGEVVRAFPTKMYVTDKGFYYFVYVNGLDKCYYTVDPNTALTFLEKYKDDKNVDIYGRKREVTHKVAKTYVGCY